MSASQRRKGARAEREACGLLTDLLGTVVQRELGQSRDGGFDARIGNIAVEVKRRERASLHAWLEQAEAGCGDLLPAVMWRPSRRGWVVCMAVEDWAELVREALNDAEALPKHPPESAQNGPGCDISTS